LILNFVYSDCVSLDARNALEIIVVYQTLNKDKLMPVTLRASRNLLLYEIVTKRMRK